MSVYEREDRTIDADPAAIAAELRERCDTVILPNSSNGGQNRKLHVPGADCSTIERFGGKPKPIECIPEGYVSWCARCIISEFEPGDLFDSDPPDNLQSAHFHGIEVRGEL